MGDDDISLQGRDEGGGSNAKLSQGELLLVEDCCRMSSTIPDTILEEDGHNDQSTSSSISNASQKTTNSGSNIADNNNDRSLMSSSSSRDSGCGFDSATSVPNLRPKKKLAVPFKRVNRSCSQGDVQLRKSFGSTDLLGKSYMIEERGGGSVVDIPRHHSVENVLNVERRRRKAPTIENGIHNVEVRFPLL